MTVLPWPSDRKPRIAGPQSEPAADPVSSDILHRFVADIPGPGHETETDRAARFDAQLADVLSHQPRDPAEAMMATHCVLLRVLADDSRRDAERPELSPEMAKKFLRGAKQFDKLIVQMRQTLTRRQARPIGRTAVSPGVMPSTGTSSDPAPGGAEVVPLRSPREMPR